MFQSPGELRHGSGEIMDLDRSWALLHLASPPPDPQRIVDRLRSESLGPFLRPVTSPGAEAVDQGEINDSDVMYWLRRPDEGLINDDFRAAIEARLADVVEERPRFVGPVYRIRGTDNLHGLVCPAPDVLIVEPTKAHAQDETLNLKLEELGLVEDVRRSRLMPGFRYYRVRSLETTSAYELREIIERELGQWVQSARFENIPVLSTLLALPNDPAFPDQWNMVRVRAGGAGLTGWDVCTGAPDVIVAIIDTGFDTNHADLSFKHLGINLETMEESAHDTTRKHGTQVAGIACAVVNNGFGIAGMAGRCRILPIRIANSDAQLAQAITYAVTEDAAVINMSIGQNDPPTWDFTIIDPAIAAAHEAGSVLCAAAGNDNISSIRYPARHPLVIACGATDRDDHRLSEIGGGSNFGFKTHAGVRTGISVMAPGIAIPTTLPNNGVGTTGMTSAAAPQVSGLAALLKTHSTKDNEEIRRIIEASATKAGDVSYASDPDFPSGTHNPELGYGLIDVMNALQMATP